MSEYVKACSTCKREIRMSNNSGKWQPFNLDNTAHRCFEKTNRAGNVGARNSGVGENRKIAPSKESLTMEDLDLRLKMVEMILLSLRSENMP
jgi:hypothetical protein